MGYMQFFFPNHVPNSISKQSEVLRAIFWLRKNGPILRRITFRGPNIQVAVGFLGPGGSEPSGGSLVVYQNKWPCHGVFLCQISIPSTPCSTTPTGPFFFSPPKCQEDGILFQIARQLVDHVTSSVFQQIGQTSFRHLFCVTEFLSTKPPERLVFPSSVFRGELLVFGRVDLNHTDDLDSSRKVPFRQLEHIFLGVFLSRNRLLMVEVSG